MEIGKLKKWVPTKALTPNNNPYFGTLKLALNVWFKSEAIFGF